ncbi:MAG: phosphoglycerate kinase [Minisyncoccia bacterium]
MKFVSNNKNDFAGKKVLVRADFNVPIDSGVVEDVYRIEVVIPTINFLREAGAKIILASHIESNHTIGEQTLKPVADILGKTLPIFFAENYFPKLNQEIEAHLSSGDVVLLENLRKYDGEKNNDEVFAKALASYADIYVNEAFSSSHREHASITKVTKFLPSYAGLQFETEMKELAKGFKPEKPFIFILGGAKFETKLPILKKFFSKADATFVGGALANDFFRDKGYEVGRSLVSVSAPHLHSFSEPPLYLPTDVVVTGGGDRITRADDVRSEEVIVDIDGESIETLREILFGAKTVIWNGPMGNYERGYSEGTRNVAKIISEIKTNSIVGGGDTVACIRKLGLQKNFTFLSTAGAAMLDYLLNETLPGIDALN